MDFFFFFCKAKKCIQVKKVHYLLLAVIEQQWCCLSAKCCCIWQGMDGCEMLGLLGRCNVKALGGREDGREWGWL